MNFPIINAKLIVLSISLIILNLLSNAQITGEVNLNEKSDDVVTGAERTEVYFPVLKNKKIAIVANHTSIIKKVHLVDTLLRAGFYIDRIFCPEHGLRGEAEAGENINNYTDSKTHLPVISLYGSKKKPNQQDFKGIDIVVFDIQDVGVRFYTYISTLSLIMEACAENNIPLIILDRPNPNGYYVDGPILDKKFTSFIGMHPVPIVYGMTVAEYACMINDEGWLKNNMKCKLQYVPLLNYDHKTLYQLPISPSPNLPNMSAIYLYPSLCLFEGTIISVARGTDFPFQAFGHPELKDAPFSFTPRSIPGVCANPIYLNKECKGYDLRSFGKNYFYNHRQIYLFWLIECYKALGSKDSFFNKDLFDKLAGNSSLREMIMQGKTEDEIRATWQNDLNEFMKIRKKYLLYPDFDN